MSDGDLEIEVKFLVADLEGLRQRLAGIGAEQKKPRTYEKNIRFDTQWQSLMLQGKLLRLRQDTAAWITFKGELEESHPSEARIREELEIEVESFDTAKAILEKVGFEAQQVYEKYRQTFQLGDVEVVLDELPYGNFVEIEGEDGAIRKAAERLDLNWTKRILKNYLAIMQDLKEYHQLTFDDLTFDNFSDQQAQIVDLIEYAD
jgi:adenylate cyclase class 2